LNSEQYRITKFDRAVVMNCVVLHQEHNMDRKMVAHLVLRAVR